MTTQHKLLLVFSSTIIFILAILIWNLVLNKGAIIVKATAPFTVDLGLKNLQSCNENECQFKLPPGIYKVKAYKNSYSSDEINIQIKRGTKMYWTPDFYYIPTVSKIGPKKNLVLPPDNSNYSHNLNDVTLLLDQDYFLKNLPPDFVDIVLNQNGQNALITSPQNYWIFDVKDNKASKLNAKKIDALSWASDSNNLFDLETDDSLHQSFLNKILLTGEKQMIVKFIKSLNKAEMQASPKGKTIIIYDETNPDSILLVNIEAKTRHKLNLPEDLKTNKLDIKAFHPEDKFVIIGDQEKSWLLDLQTEDFQLLNISASNAIFVLNDHEIVFVEGFFENGYKDATFVSQNEDSIVNITYPSKIYDIQLDIYNLIDLSLKKFPIALDKALYIQKFELKDQNLYFEAGGDIYKIELRAER